jgi:hydrogenase assembly chaperone HypC/HupF
MCRIAPARVMRIEGPLAWIETAGRTTSASLQAVDDVHVGDYVLCYAGIVLERLAPDEAEAILNALADIEMFDQEPA